MLDEERLRIVANDVVAVFTHDSKSLRLRRVEVAVLQVGEADVNKFWWLSKLHHLDWKMLSSSIMNGDLTIRRASHKESANIVISQATKWQLELGELVQDFSCLDVEDPHLTRLETAGKDGLRGMGADRNGLVNR